MLIISLQQKYEQYNAKYLLTVETFQKAARNYSEKVELFNSHLGEIEQLQQRYQDGSLFTLEVMRKADARCHNIEQYLVDQIFMKDEKIRQLCKTIDHQRVLIEEKGDIE